MGGERMELRRATAGGGWRGEGGRAGGGGEGGGRTAQLPPRVHEGTSETASHPSPPTQADSSILNGVVPHPSLPILASYGIDPTGKLWVSGGRRDASLVCRDELPRVLESNIDEVKSRGRGRG